MRDKCWILDWKTSEEVNFILNTIEEKFFWQSVRGDDTVVMSIKVWKVNILTSFLNDWQTSFFIEKLLDTTSSLPHPTFSVEEEGLYSRPN